MNWNLNAIDQQATIRKANLQALNLLVIEAGEIENAACTVVTWVNDVKKASDALDAEALSIVPREVRNALGTIRYAHDQINALYNEAIRPLAAMADACQKTGE